MEFAYHRKLAPILGVLLGLALVESCVVHIVAMAYWGRWVAIALAAIDLSLVATLVALLRSFRRCPILLADGVLTLRTGWRLHLAVPVADIAGFRTHWTTEDVRGRDVLNMALLAWPTVMIDLRHPIRQRSRTITAVAHCPEDPEALRRAVLAALEPHSSGTR